MHLEDKMEFWVDMINSRLIEKIFYFSLVFIFSYLSSWYYQYLVKIPFNSDVAFCSVLVGLCVFIFIFATFWWSFPSAVLSGILGGFAFTRRVT